MPSSLYRIANNGYDFDMAEKHSPPMGDLHIALQVKLSYMQNIQLSYLIAKMILFFVKWQFQFYLFLAVPPSVIHFA